jgi:RNA polymerase sigma-70 factor (ECF subfamily)
MSYDASESGKVTVISDSSLLERMRQGDEASFETLFYRHYDRVYGLLFRLTGNRADAEDLAQEVFLKLYRQPLPARRDHNVSAWLYRVATNGGYNHIRNRRRRWQRDRILVPDSSDNLPDPADEVVRKETQVTVQAALSHIPKRQTQLLLLRQMGLSYAELAEACDVAPGSVGKMLSRAGEAFRRAYQKETGPRDE